MNLYERDFNKGLTEEEKQEFKEVMGISFSEKQVCGLITSYNRYKYPKVAKRYSKLFPNNYLDSQDLRDTVTIKGLNNNFLDLINDNSNNERIILNYIKETKSYHIIASIIKGLSYRFGNHGIYLFPEFQLGNLYLVDYLLLGKNSGGYEFVFVELEDIKNAVLKTGKLGMEFRDGISQLRDWKRWLPNGFNSNFSATMKKAKNPNINLPDEFYNLDMSRFHYVVIAGRRSDFTDLTYTIKRETKKTEDIDILHYDNLYDFATLLVTQGRY